MALTTCACDTGTSTALQPQSGAFCQLQSDSGLPCCNVCASCQTASSPFYSVNINRGRWDCQEWLMAHLNSQSTVMEISTWKGGIAGSSRFSIPRYIFPLHNYFKYKVFFGRSCYICSYTLCFTKPRFWSDNFAQFSTACSLTYVFPHNFSQRLNALVILQYVYFYITMSVVEPQMNTLGYSIQAYIEHVCTYTNGRTRHRRKALRNTTRN